MSVQTKIMLFFVFLMASKLAASQVDQKSDTLEIWTYGLGNFINENAHIITSKKWPFEAISKAGCVMIEDEINEIENHNQAVWHYLDTNGFENSEKQYHSEFKSEYERIKEAVDLLNQHSKIIQLHKRLRRKRYTNYTNLNKTGAYNYEFEIYSFDPYDIVKPEKFEISLTVDIEHKCVKIIK